jgi:hypothetical protein
MKTFELQVNIESFRGIEIDMPNFTGFQLSGKSQQKQIENHQTL